MKIYNLYFNYLYLLYSKTATKYYLQLFTLDLISKLHDQMTAIFPKYFRVSLHNNETFYENH